MNLLNSKGFKKKPDCGNNSYYVYEHFDNLVPTGKPPTLSFLKTPLEPSAVSLEPPNAPSEIPAAMALETPLTEPLRSSKTPHTPQPFSETNFCKEINLVKDCVKTLETENEAKNEETLNEKVKPIGHLQKASKKLEQENYSKTTIIKILIETKTSNIPTTQSNTEQYKL